MKIEYLGHAGFCVETNTAFVVIDPYIHDIAEPFVRKLTDSRKQKLVYLSREAEEGCDVAQSLRDRSHLLYPEFAQARFSELSFRRKTAFHDGQRIDFGDGTIDVFLDAAARDAAIFIRSGVSSFLKINDVRPTDRMRSFRRRYGSVEALAAPYSNDDEYLDLLQPKILLSSGSPDLLPGDVFDVEELRQRVAGYGERIAPERTVIERRERIEVVAGGCVYEIDRLCPHQGGDLTRARIEDERYVVCPMHQWAFDLTNGGACTTNATTIRAERKDR